MLFLGLHNRRLRLGIGKNSGSTVGEENFWATARLQPAELRVSHDVAILFRCLRLLSQGPRPEWIGPPNLYCSPQILF